MDQPIHTQELSRIGFRYFPSFVSQDEAEKLELLLASLPYRDIHMRGQVARRRVTCFGYDYIYVRRSVEPTEPMPAAIAMLRDRAEQVTADGFPLCQAIVTSYPTGAGINWHTDSPVFGPSIVGVSLGAPARLHVRRGTEMHRVTLESGSAYVLAGLARSEWQHRLAPVAEQRYSITFRSLRRT